jgi:hypothetical protein
MGRYALKDSIEIYFIFFEFYYIFYDFLKFLRIFGNVKENEKNKNRGTVPGRLQAERRGGPTRAAGHKVEWACACSPATARVA